MTECVNITVIFTDKSIRSYSLESRSTVLSFKKIVANSHEIEHEKFFGFYYQDEQKNNYWLSDEKYLCHYDVLKSSNFRTRLYFAFKYLVQFDYWISDAMTKRLFYHQLKQQLYDGDIVSDSDLCFKLLAMTLLLEDEKLKSFEEIKKMNMISAHLFVKHPSIEHCVKQIISNYEQLESISKDEIRKKFIVHILELPYQLTHYFYAKNFNSSTIAIAINNNGFFEGEKCNRSSIKLTYAWSEITNITHHKSRVSIDIQDLRHKSSIRRKSSALSISYDLLNSDLAKSLVYLAKDTINFISQNMEPMSIMSTTTPRRNPNNIKKNHPSYTYSGKPEKYRPSAQNTFITENDIMMSRSSSRISLTSSNYAGSCLTNDSASLLLDDELLNTPVNVPEKQKIFVMLYEKRKNIIAQLNEKVKDAVQNCLLEKNITKIMPSDYLILDPKSQIKLTKFAIRTQVSGSDVSAFQKKKNSIIEEIETLQNIIGKLKENEKKHRIEIKKKSSEINSCTKRLQTLEEEHARELYILNNSRSNSEGCLFPYPNGNIPVINGYATVKSGNLAPMTEPRSRKNTVIYGDRSSSGTDTLKSCSIKYPRMKSTDSHVSDITSLSTSPLKVDAKTSPNYSNNSQFQRFTSTRSQIKGLPSKFPISVIQKNDSNSSVESNYSAEAPDPTCPRSSNSNTDSEYSEDPIIEMRSHSLCTGEATHCVRDSREINLNRAKISYKVSNMKLMSRNKSIPNNNPDRNSVSLEELREDISEASEAQRLFAVKPRREHFESPSFISKLTYHPSKKDGKPPIHITRGKQPSIIRKAARSNGSQDRL